MGPWVALALFPGPHPHVHTCLVQALVVVPPGIWVREGLDALHALKFRRVGQGPGLVLLWLRGSSILLLRGTGVP